MNLLAAGEEGAVQGHGDQIPLLHVLRPGDNLKGLSPPCIHLADPHMVAVLVALHGQHLAHHHVFDLIPHVVGQLHLGAGEGHGLGELPVAGVDLNKLVEPFSG